MRYHTPSQRRNQSPLSNSSLDRHSYKRKVDEMLLRSAPGKKWGPRYVSSFMTTPKRPEKYLAKTSSTSMTVFGEEDWLTRDWARPKLTFAQFYKGKLVAEGKFGKVFAVK
jgi:hypothetical protein